MSENVGGPQSDSPTSDLLQAVRELVQEVDALSKRLSKDYPSREEVRHEGRIRMFKSLAFGICIIIVANLLTLQTISYCFLAPSGTVHSECNFIPGYKSTVEVGNQRLARFELLLTQIEENQRAIIDLQTRLDKLERQER